MKLQLDALQSLPLAKPPSSAVKRTAAVENYVASLLGARLHMVCRCRCVGFGGVVDFPHFISIPSIYIMCRRKAEKKKRNKWRVSNKNKNESNLECHLIKYEMILNFT